MDDKIESLLAALIEAVDRLGTKTTGDVVDVNRSNSDDKFAPSPEQIKSRQNKQLAESIAEETDKKQKEGKSRKIVKELMPVNVMGFDNKALEQLGKVISKDMTRSIKKQTTTTAQEQDSNMLLKALAFGAMASVGPLISAYYFFKEIGKQKWFNRLKSMLKQNPLKVMSGVFRPITTFFRWWNRQIMMLGELILNVFKPFDPMFKMLGDSVRELRKAVLSPFQPIRRFYNKVVLQMDKIGGSIRRLLQPMINFLEDIPKKLNNTRVRIIKNLEPLSKLFSNITLKANEIRKSLVSALKLIPDLFKPGMFAATLTSIKLALAPVTKLFSSLGARVSNIFKPITNTISRLVVRLSSALQPLRGVFDLVMKGVRASGKMIQTALSPIFGSGTKPNIFTRLTNMIINNPVVKTMKSFFAGLGKVLGKIFLPLTIITGLYDAISGFMKGYGQTGSVIEGVRVGLTKAFNGLVALPLNLIKDLVSWIAGKFGFTNVEKTLDKFSFTTLFTDIIDSLFKKTDELIVNLKTKITNLFKPGKNFGQLLKDITSFVGEVILLPYDLVKDTISWIAGKFGFKQAEKTLDSFTFTQMFDQTIESIVSFFGFGLEMIKLLFTNPQKAFEEVSKMFDELLQDPVGKMKQILPKWVVDFAGWFKDTILLPIEQALMFTSEDPEESKQIFLNKLPAWMTGFGSWLFDRVIKPISDLFAELNKDPKGAFKKLLPPWALDMGGYVAGKFKKIFEGIEEIFKPLMEFDWSSLVPDWVKDLTGVQDEKDKKQNEKWQQLQQDKKTVQLGTIESALPPSLSARLKENIALGRSGDLKPGHTDMAQNLARAAMKSNRGGLMIDGKRVTLSSYEDMAPDEKAAIREQYQKIIEDSTDYSPYTKKILNQTELGKLLSGTKTSMNDFIWRPGEKPMTFNKGDILIGSHQDNYRDTPTTQSVQKTDKELINRVDKMVDLMAQHSEIQTKVLEVLTESGLMDKQGNTVVNNGGNSTVINNPSSDNSIMNFRDRVIGR